MYIRTEEILLKDISSEISFYTYNNLIIFGIMFGYHLVVLHPARYNRTSHKTSQSPLTRQKDRAEAKSCKTPKPRRP